MKDGEFTIPETPWERFLDKARHFTHRLKLPRRQKQPVETWDPTCAELLADLLDD